MQHTTQTGGPSSAIESADGVKVKREKTAGLEASFEGQDKEKMEPDDLWLKVHKEVKLTFAAANSPAGHVFFPAVCLSSILYIFLHRIWPIPKRAPWMHSLHTQRPGRSSAWLFGVPRPGVPPGRVVVTQ